MPVNAKDKLADLSPDRQSAIRARTAKLANRHVNHTPIRNFRFSDETMAALDRISERHQIDRTNMLRYLIHSTDQQAKP